MKKIYMYVLDTMADWENGYLLQGLTLQRVSGEFKYELQTVSISKKPIKTSGGITIVPDITIDEINDEQAGALLLIGADAWSEKVNQQIIEVAHSFLKKGILVAAICGATLGLADAKILNSYYHTSNALFFLKGQSKKYQGEKYYKDVPAVMDRNLITASSAGSLLWAKYIFESLKLYSYETTEAWYNYFSSGKVEYFEEMIASLSAST